MSLRKGNARKAKRRRASVAGEEDVSFEKLQGLLDQTPKGSRNPAVATSGPEGSGPARLPTLSEELEATQLPSTMPERLPVSATTTRRTSTRSRRRSSRLSVGEDVTADMMAQALAKLPSEQQQQDASPGRLDDLAMTSGAMLGSSSTSGSSNLTNTESNNHKVSSSPLAATGSPSTPGVAGNFGSPSSTSSSNIAAPGHLMGTPRAPLFHDHSALQPAGHPLTNAISSSSKLAGKATSPTSSSQRAKGSRPSKKRARGQARGSPTAKRRDSRRGKNTSDGASGHPMQMSALPTPSGAIQVGAEMTAPNIGSLTFHSLSPPQLQPQQQVLQQPLPQHYLPPAPHPHPHPQQVLVPQQQQQHGKQQEGSMAIPSRAMNPILSLEKTEAEVAEILRKSYLLVREDRAASRAWEMADKDAPPDEHEEDPFAKKRRKDQKPYDPSGARAIKYPPDRPFKKGLDVPLLHLCDKAEGIPDRLKLQKLRDATRLLQECNQHVLEPLTMYSQPELYELMSSIAEVWKNSGKSAWKKRINKIKENARHRKARKQLDDNEKKEIAMLEKRIAAREKWEKGIIQKQKNETAARKDAAVAAANAARASAQMCVLPILKHGY